MSIMVNLDNNQSSILRFKFEKSWNWNDWYNAESKSMKLIEESDQPVDIVMDLSQAGAKPHNIISQISMLLRQYPPNLNRIYFVGADSVIQKLIHLCSGFRPDLKENLVFVPAEAELYAYS